MLKNKKIIRLLTLLLVLIICLGGYLVVRTIDFDESEEKDTETIELVSMKAADIRAFSYQHEGENCCLVKNNEDGTWYVNGDETYTLDQTAIESMVSQIAGMTADRQFEAASDLSDYGFGEPSNVIVFSDGEENEHTVTIGNQNTSSGQYYAQVDGGTDIYLIDSVLPNAFSVSLEELKEEEISSEISSGV